MQDKINGNPGAPMSSMTQLFVNEDLHTSKTSPSNNDSNKKSFSLPPALRFTPASLVSGFFLALLLFAPESTGWAQNKLFAFFHSLKGNAPPSSEIILVKTAPANFLKIAKIISASRPKTLTIDLPTYIDASISKIEDFSTLNYTAIIVSHRFQKLQPWTLNEEAIKPYPAALNHSLYPLLDNPGQGLNLPMGKEILLPDILKSSSSFTTGFSGLYQKGEINSNSISPRFSSESFSIPAFAKLGRGIVANLGIETARRVLGVANDKVAYLEGIGILFNAENILPIGKTGKMVLRFHGSNGFKSFTEDQILNGKVSANDLQGKIVFLDASSSDANGLDVDLISTAGGLKSSTEIWAEAASNLLDHQTLTAPDWGKALAITLGIIFTGLIILISVLEVSTPMTVGIGLGLALIYPLLSLFLFQKSNLWLPPALPFFLVLGGLIPFISLRFLFPSSKIIPVKNRVKPIDILPSHTIDPIFMPSTKGIPRIQNQNPSITPPATPKVIAVKIEENASNSNPPISGTPLQESKFVDPRDPPILPGTSGSAPIKESQVVNQTPAAAPASQPSSEIERDAKGGLIRIGKYRIIRKMGFGSAGDVFEGMDTHMNRLVAIKTITKNAITNFDHAAERFVVEAKAAGSLNHPCINTVYDFGTIRDVSFMVLEHLDGITLSQWMRNHPTPPSPQFVSTWLQQISSAMDYAHSHKIIHRDLKPANLMVVNNGATIKLLDFGIAKMEDVGLTQTGMTVGTPSYMSPEQLSGLKVSPASDQYSLAVVIYQLLTYKLPYIGTKIPELCNRILKNEIVPITDINPALGDPFWQALRRSFSKAPENRYANCMEMYQALENSFPV